MRSEKPDMGRFAVIAVVSAAIAAAFWLLTPSLGPLLALGTALVLGGITIDRFERPYKLAILLPLTVLIVAEVVRLISRAGEGG